MCLSQSTIHQNDYHMKSFTKNFSCYYYGNTIIEQSTSYHKTNDKNTIKKETEALLNKCLYNLNDIKSTHPLTSTLARCQKPHCKTCPIHPSSLSFTSLVTNLAYLITPMPLVPPATSSTS